MEISLSISLLVRTIPYFKLLITCVPICTKLLVGTWFLHNYYQQKNKKIMYRINEEFSFLCKRDVLPYIWLHCILGIWILQILHFISLAVSRWISNNYSFNWTIKKHMYHYLRCCLMEYCQEINNQLVVYNLCLLEKWHKDLGNNINSTFTQCFKKSIIICSMKY